MRDYSIFNPSGSERSMPLPALQWDSQVTMACKVEDLSQIALQNYRLVEGLDEPDKNLVNIILTFAQLDHTIQHEFSMAE